MKIFLTAVMLCALTIAGNPSRVFAQVKYFDAPETGSVTVTSFGFGKNRSISSADACAAAINTLLFVGVPGSQYELPMVTDEAKRNNPVVKNLFNGGYSQFITQSDFLSEETLSKKIDGVKGKSAQYKLTINCDALRRYLEKNGVIRKFGI
jgi:hypothetical protein